MSKFTPGPWLVCAEDDDERGLTIFAESQLVDGRIPAAHWDDHIAVVGVNHSNHEAHAQLIAAAPELLEALQDYEAAMNMPIYGDYSDFVFPENKPRVEGNSAWGNICAKHGLSYGGGCICCRDDFNNHKERKDYLARCASDDALRAARNKARAVIAKATGGSHV